VDITRSISHLFKDVKGNFSKSVFDEKIKVWYTMLEMNLFTAMPVK